VIFEKGYLYHVYNQGNNRQKIFFKRDNYLFFLSKIHNCILPFADVLAWCLMPNHFHLMILINEESQGFTLSEALTKDSESKGLTSNMTENSQTLTHRTINESIGILLRTYTRAINKQEGVSGSLFRKETKAECINNLSVKIPSFLKDYKVSQIRIAHPEKQYPQICFDYIHQNPVKAKLVRSEIDWEFSSAKDYAELRNGKLISKEVAKEYVTISYMNI